MKPLLVILAVLVLSGWLYGQERELPNHDTRIGGCTIQSNPRVKVLGEGLQVTANIYAPTYAGKGEYGLADKISKVEYVAAVVYQSPQGEYAKKYVRKPTPADFKALQNLQVPEHWVNRIAVHSQLFSREEINYNKISDSLTVISTKEGKIPIKENPNLDKLIANFNQGKK